MKKINFKLAKILSALALMVTVMNVNQTCLFFDHQPKLPENSTKLRKF